METSPPTAADVERPLPRGIAAIGTSTSSYTGPLTPPEFPLLADLLQADDLVVLVTPIDHAAPKGRLILPQQQVIREILDAGAQAVVTQVAGLQNVLNTLTDSPRLVVTDSQAFGEVAELVPENVKLTSFSILFARKKGLLTQAVAAISALDQLHDDDRVLISEGCSHHRQCDDIGTVKLPQWISEYTKKKLRFEFTSGGKFPEALQDYQLIVHCGGCLLNDRTMHHRLAMAAHQEVAITNYGNLIAQINGILERSVAPIL